LENPVSQEKLNLLMLDDFSVLSEIYSSDQRARSLDVMSVGSTPLEKRSLWRHREVGAGNTTVLVEYDEYKAKEDRAEKRLNDLMVLLVLHCLKLQSGGSAVSFIVGFILTIALLNPFFFILAFAPMMICYTYCGVTGRW
jgi:hypothetical protein